MCQKFLVSTKESLKISLSSYHFSFPFRTTYTFWKWIFIKGLFSPKTCSSFDSRQGTISFPWSSLPKISNRQDLSISVTYKMMSDWSRRGEKACRFIGRILTYKKEGHVTSNFKIPYSKGEDKFFGRYLLLCICCTSFESDGPSSNSPVSILSKILTSPFLKIKRTITWKNGKNQALKL